MGNFGLAWFMVFNATFNNILLVEETRVPKEMVILEKNSLKSEHTFIKIVILEEIH